MKSPFLTTYLLLVSFSILAQIDTFSSYHTLTPYTFLSPEDHPIQIARILPKRAGSLQGLQFHLAGGIGTCQIHIYGHEGGTNFPWFQDDLISPIELQKSQKGDTTITIRLTDTLSLDRQQFYIALTDFKGIFGIKQDSTYYEPFCASNNGGNYYPTLLLSRDSAQWIGDNCAMAMDLLIQYQPLSPPIFKEVTMEAGCSLNLSNQSIAWADINADGWEDLLLGSHFYLNKGGIFDKVKLSIPTFPNNPIRASTFLDMNNDGFWDILLFGTKKSILLLNDGKGDFKAQTTAIPPLPALQAYSIADINADKYPDLLLAQLWGNYPEPMPNYLLLNNQQSDFTDHTQRLYPQHRENHNFPTGIACIAGVDSTYLPSNNRNRRSRATQFVDYDLDGDADLYIANYFLEEDEFYENNGKGQFTLRTSPKPDQQSPTTANHGTGIAWYDYDNDGDMDVLVPQLAHPRFMKPYDHRGTVLYQNEAGIFKDITIASGIQYEETHAGACFGDINNDGLVDLLFTAYYGCRYLQIYLQQPDHTFQLSTDQTGLAQVSTEADACFVDFNNDGLLDIASGNNQQFRLYQNQSTTANNWLKIKLNAESVHHVGTNVLVKVYTTQGVYTQAPTIGKGQKMQAPTTLHFGLGTATEVIKLAVYFNPTAPAVYEGLSVNQTYIIDE